MANIIGQLLVELGINTAALKRGLDKATYMAKQFAHDAGESIGELKNAVMQLGAEFGVLGGAGTEAFSKIIDVVKPLASMVETPQGAVLALGSAFAVMGIAADGIAIKFSETAARAKDLSAVTGLSVEQISALGDVAETKGVSMDAMARALTRMDKSALAAAQSGPHATNAYKDLGIAVTNTDGSMRSANDIFEAVANKFAKMPDGPQKTAEAIKIFGRTGMELIPILDKGSEGITELEKKFGDLGAIIDTDTGAASEKLKEDMTLMGGAFTGIENQLTKALLPALTVAAESFTDFFVENKAEITGFVEELAFAGKTVINVFQVLAGVFELINNAFRLAIDAIVTTGATAANVLSDLKNGRFKQIWSDIKDGASLASAGVKEDFTKAINDIAGTAKNIGKVWTDVLPKTKENRSEKEDPTKNAGNFDFIDKAVKNAETAAAKMAELAKAIGEVGAAQIEASATAQAMAEKQKLLDEATTKFTGSALTEAKAKIEAVADRLKQAALWTETFKAAIGADKELQNFNNKMESQLHVMDEAIAGTSALDKEYEKNQQSLAPLSRALQAVRDEYDKLKATPGANPAYVKELGENVDKLSKEYQLAATNVDLLNKKTQEAKVSDEIRKIEEQTAALAAENKAIVSGNPFGKMDADLAKLRLTLKLTDDQYKELLKTQQAMKEETIKSEVLGKAKGMGFDPQAMAQMKQQIDFLNQNWKTLGLSAEQYRQVLLKIEAEQAQLAAKTGNWQKGVSAAIKQFESDTRTMGQVMSDVIGKGLQGIEDNFASMIATGKASWSSLVADMETMLLKSAIHKILSSLFNFLGNQGGFLGSLFGGGGGGGFGGARAGGGDTMPGKTYLVGEKGPELFTPGSSGTVHPSGSFGGQTINQQFNISTPNADSFHRSRAQISSQMYRDAAYAHGRMKG